MEIVFHSCANYSFIIITWIAGNVSSSVGPVEHWSWGIGMWAFIFPLANIPFLLCLGYMWFKARQLDEWKGLAGFKRRILKEQGVGKFLVDLFWDLDIVGAVLMVVCLGCILVPLTLAGGVHSKWQNYQIYVPIIIGGVLIPVFIIWEKYFSENPIAPMLFFTNRGIWCPLAISFLFMFIDMTVQEYLYTVLVVAVNQSVTSATRITSLPSFVGEIVGLLYGLFTVEIRRLKPFLVFGTLMWMLALGLMYYYRGGSSSKAGIIAAQCVMGFGTGFFSYPITVVMQSNVKHEHLAVVTGLGYALYRIGGAVGSSVGGAIWSQLLYKELLKRLGDSTEAALCFNDPFTYILDQPWGTAVRNEIVMAYRHVQRILILVGLVFCAPLILLAILTKDRKLSKEISLEHEHGEEEPFSVIQWIKDKYADRKEAKSESS